MYGYMPGMTGAQAREAAPSQFQSSGNLIVSDRDGSSIQVYSDCCYDFMPFRMGWCEMAS